MKLLNDILKHGELFKEMRRSSTVSEGELDSRLYKESTVRTQLQMETTINKAYYFCERAMAKIDGTIAEQGAMFKEAARKGASETDITELFQEGIKEIGNALWTTLVTMYKAFVAAINSVRAFFVSQKGVLRKLDKVVEILKANSTKKPKAGAKVNIPMLIKTDAKDKDAIVKNLIKSINSLFILSEGGIYASAEIHLSSGKVIVPAGFDKYITEAGSLDPLKEFAKSVKELTAAAPTQETVMAGILKAAETMNGEGKNPRVIDALLYAPMAFMGTMVSSDIAPNSRKDTLNPKDPVMKRFNIYAKQMPQSLGKKPISTVILDSITREVSSASVLPRLRANTVKFVADEGYLNIPELTKGLEAAKEQIKRLFVGRKENLATLVGQIMTQTNKLLSQTKKGSASMDKVAKKAGNADGVADKQGTADLLAGAKSITSACNLLIKDYTRTVAECKIGINTLLNGTAKLVGKTISKEDGTGFEEDFNPEEDAKEGFKSRRVADRNTEEDNSYGASRKKWGRGAGKATKTKDSKGYTKDIVSEVTNDHVSAKELAKRKAVQNRGAKR